MTSLLSLSIFSEYYFESFGWHNIITMILKNKLFAFLIVCIFVFDANNNNVLASCSTANEENECCWLVRYEDKISSTNDRPGFQDEITEAFQVRMIKVLFC